MMRIRKSGILAALSIVIAMVMLFMAIIASPVRANAEENGQDKQYVIDDGSLLTQSQEEELQKLCKDKSEKCKTDIVIITIDKKMSDTEIESYAKKILFEKYGFNGTGTDCDAVCYIIDIDKDTRADRIVFSGNAFDDVTSKEWKNVQTSAEKKLKSDQYYEGCVKFIKGVELKMNPSFWFKCTTYLPIKLLISLAVAVVVVLIMMFNAKAKMTVSGNTYAKGHHGQLVGQNDRFINTTVVRRKIETNHNSGGGGGGGGGHSGSVGGHF